MIEIDIVGNVNMLKDSKDKKNNKKEMMVTGTMILIKNYPEIRIWKRMLVIRPLLIMDQGMVNQRM